MQDSMPSPFEFDGMPDKPGKKTGFPSFFKNNVSDDPDEDTEAERTEVTSVEEVAAVFDNKGPLSEKEGYRIRPGQVQMATDVLRAIYGRHNLVVEAGTGVGKTFAYLVPILLSRRKALISTYSKALQDQLFNKDINFLKSVLGIDADVAVLKGASNYLCLKNMGRIFGVPDSHDNDPSETETAAGGFSPDMQASGVGTQTELMTDFGPALSGERVARNKKIIAGIKNYLKCARTGEVDEFKNYMQSTVGAEPAELSLNRIGVSKISCSKKSCRFYELCYLVAARKKAKVSKIVILNQSLLCYGVQNDEMLFPKADIVVVDEAHKFEDTLRDAFSAEIGTESINEAINSVYMTRAHEMLKADTRTNEKAADKKKAAADAKTEAGKEHQARKEEDPRIKYERELLDEVNAALTDLKRFVDGKSSDSFTSFIDNVYTDEECNLLPEYEKQSYRISTCASGKSRNTVSVLPSSEEAVLLDLNLEKFIKGLHKFGEKVGAVYFKLTRLTEGIRILFPEGRIPEGRGGAEVKDYVEELEDVIRVFTDTYDFIGGIIQYINTCKNSGMMASSYYYWYRKVNSGEFTITRSPFRPSLEFSNFFLSKSDCFRSFIFASATIDTAGAKSPAIDLLKEECAKREDARSGKETDFPNFRYGIGLSSDNTECRTVYSPFDFKNNAILCVPEDLANFTSNYEESNGKNKVYSCPINTLKMLAPVINATKGGIFILVTSYDACHRYAEALRKNQVTTLGFNRVRKVFEQEKNITNNNLLISRFREAGDAVLIGTKSFWEGVDIPGSALSLVIIDKIPFPQKTVHRFMTRMMYESEGFNAFDRVDVTSAIIDLKQGVGRLIRTETDKGAVIICSKELLNSANKSYAGRIINSLSYFNMTNSIDVVKDLMERDFDKK